MLPRRKFYFFALILDVAILTLLVLFKFNFVFPSNDQFIFSGDFIRPITQQGAVEYYLFPLLLNEHGTFIDPTAILRVPYWSLVLFLSNFISLNVNYWLLIIITQVFSGLLVSSSARTLFSPKGIWAYYLLPLLPSIFTIFAYPINYRPYWLFLPFLPGLIQWVLIILYQTNTNHQLSFRSKILLVLLGYLASLQVHNILFIEITLASVFFVILWLQKRKFVMIKNYLEIAFWVSFPFLLFMIPTFLVTFNGQLFSPSYIYSYSVLDFMSSNANFVNAFVFSIGFWEKVFYTNFDKLITVLLVSSIVVFSFLVKRRKPFLLSVLMVFVISISFQLGINNPLYSFLADPSNQISWLLRDPFKISLVSLGLFVTIFTFTMNHFSLTVTSKVMKRIVVTLVIVLLVLTAIVWSPSTKTSEILQPSTIPNEYFTAVEYLNENIDGPLVFFPIECLEYSWAENSYLEGSFLAKSYQGSYIDYIQTNSREAKEFLTYATSLQNVELLSLITSGVVIDLSMEGRGSSFDKVVQHIYSNYTEDLIKFGDYLYFLPNYNYSSFKIGGAPIFLVSSTDYTYVGSFSEFLNMERDLLFFDSYDWLLSKGQELKLSSNVVNPSKTWSLGYTHDPLHAPWHNYLEEQNLTNWQSDYGKGLVFTWAESALTDNPTPDNNDLIKEWTFNSLTDVENWKDYTSENQSGSLYSINWDNEALKAELSSTSRNWKTISSPLIPAEYGGTYKLEFETKGENVQNMHIKIVEYDQEQKIVNAHPVRTVGSGSFDWNNIAIDYNPEDPETRFIQLQVWHGFETTQPLPNVIWLKNVKIYDLARFCEPVVLTQPFSVLETNEYVLLARIFQNQQGGKIQVNLNDKKYLIDTKDPINKFVWKEIDTLQLREGQCKLTIENLEGFNAVNLFTIITKQQFQEAQDQLENTLVDQRIVYILEAEKDFYVENGLRNTRKIEEASNGVVLEVNNSKVYSQIEILNPGDYSIAIRSKGKLNIVLNKKTHDIDSSKLDWTFLPPITLDKGKYTLEILNSQETNLKNQNLNTSYLDAVWLYSTQNPDEHLEDIFVVNQIPANIVNFQKIDSTKFNVEVNATDPFMLSFAQAYDSSWIVNVNGEKINSMPLYSVTNGFWINQTGVLEITIEYEPQKLFNYGLTISLLILTTCAAYLTITYAKNNQLLQRIKNLFIKTTSK